MQDGPSKSEFSDLCDGDGLLVTHLHAAFASEALFSVHRHRLSILDLINIHRANLNALLTAFALVGVNYYFVSHLPKPPAIKICNYLMQLYT
jgi:hypothetical protein